MVSRGGRGTYQLRGLTMPRPKSKFVRHEACPQCNSKDNLARFSDGHAYCFGCNYTEQPEREPKLRPIPPMPPPPVSLLSFVDCVPLTKRGLDKETTELFGYGVGNYNGSTVQVATYRNQRGQDVAQHLRYPDKKFRWIGDTSDIQLWGQHLWRQNHGKETDIFCVITEGEVDAMSVSQVQGNRFPVVSLPNGAQSASKYIAANLPWLRQFRIVLCLDSDPPGIKAAEEAIKVLPYGRAAICRLPRKDANEMLQAGEGAQLKDLLWKATPVRPDGILNAADLYQEMVKPGATKACDLPWPQLNSCLRGFRKGEMLTVTAGSGTGKSSVCRELAHHFLRCGLKVGMLSLEESLQRTMQGIVGIEVNKPLHLDPGAVPAERVEAAFHSLFGGGRLFLYDHFGSMDPDRMVEQIKYLADVEGVDVVFLDHLTIVVSGIADLDERRALDVVCTKLRQVVEQTGIGLVLVSHLKRPEGRGHEEGAQTSLSQLRGSHAIAQLSDCVLGCERNQQGDPAERSELQLRVLKNRFCGTTGPVDKLLYDQDSGRLTIPMSHYFGT